MNTTTKQFELMAMQSLLPGLTFAAERSLDTLNEARSALSLPLVTMQVGDPAPKRGRPPKAASAAHLPIVEDNPEIHEAPGSRRRSTARKKQKESGGRKMTASQRKRVGQATRQRWEIVREAGIKPKSGSPSNIEVARALKIIEKKTKAEAA